MSAKKFVTYGDGFADIELSKAIKVDGTDVKSLRMREPTVLDQRASQKAEGDNGDKETILFANLCGILPTDLNVMCMRDYGRVQTAYLGFID